MVCPVSTLVAKEKPVGVELDQVPDIEGRRRLQSCDRVAPRLLGRGAEWTRVPGIIAMRGRSGAHAINMCGTQH